MKSIRIYLFTNLLVGVLFATSLAVLGHMFSGYKHIKPHLDAQLVIMANTINLFLSGHNDDKKTIAHLNGKHEASALEADPIEYDDELSLDELLSSVDNMQFRIFNRYNQVLHASPKAPPVPGKALQRKGFFELHYNNNYWRSYHRIGENGNHIVVMQPSETRIIIERSTSLSAILTSLLTIPPLGLFIFIVIGRSLQSIQVTTSEIRQRAHNHLEAINTQQAPIEIMPLIQELNSLFSRLRDNFDRESRFAGDAAHELKTPLAALKTHAQIISKSDDIHHIKTELNTIDRCINRATHTVDQLLMLSRTMPDAYNHKHVAIPLPALIREVFAELALSAIAKNINIELHEQQQNPHATVLGHASTLRLLFINLIDNAIRYSPENTNIIAEVQENDSHYTVSIIDQGIGIPEELRSRVFERFYRVIGTKTQGTGLGLNIVKQIADLHHATLELKTPDSGHGTQVNIILDKQD